MAVKSARIGQGPTIAALLSLLGCLIGQTTHAADIVPRACRPLLTELAATFSVHVEPARGRLKIGERKYSIKAEPVTSADLDRSIPVLASELHLYPVAFVRLLKLKRIVLCNNPFSEGASLGGFTDVEAGTVYLNVASAREADNDLRAALHHELFHLLDYADDEILYEDEEWASHNPQGFAYGAFKFAPDGSLVRNKSLKGFVTEYSLTDPAEDKAEVFAHLIVSAARVNKQCRDDPYLQAKVRAMKLRLAAFCPEIDNQFWDSATNLARPRSLPTPLFSGVSSRRRIRRLPTTLKAHP